MITMPRHCLWEDPQLRTLSGIKAYLTELFPYRRSTSLSSSLASSRAPARSLSPLAVLLSCCVFFALYRCEHVRFREGGRGRREGRPMHGGGPLIAL